MPDGLNLSVSGWPHSESLCGAFNRPGSGLGPQQQRPLHVNRWKEWIEQLHRVARAAQRPGVPTYVIGSSWGARPALAAVAGDQRDFAGAILLNPALKTRRDFAFFVQSWFGIAIFLAPNESMRIPLRECDYTPRQATRVGWLRDPRMTNREISSFVPRSRLIAIFRISNVPNLSLQLLQNQSLRRSKR